MSSALLGSAWRTATPEAADTVMNRPSRDLMNEVFPGVAVADSLPEFGTLLAIDGARRRLGYEPADSWRDPIDGNHVD